VTLGVSPDWYRDFFGREWLDLATQQFALERTQAQVDFILEVVGLAPAAAVLDLCCGHGRHSVELAKRGYQVAGLDISELSLELARTTAADAGVLIEFIHGDMRDIPYQAQFDLVINLFTAFGYLESQAEDQKVLEAVAKALKPGGRFFIDTINQAWLMRHFEARGWRALEDGALMLEDREFDLRTGRNNVTWMMLFPDGRRHDQSHSLRVYTLVEFEAMLTAAGLVLQQAWGSFEGDPYGMDTNRMILLAERSNVVSQD
jgi:SAM-dependent methyltransferase